MFRLRSITLLTICALLIGGIGPGASPSFADDANEIGGASSELPPVKGEYSVEGDGDPDDYGITIPDTGPVVGPSAPVIQSSWSWRTLVVWLSDLVSLRN